MLLFACMDVSRATLYRTLKSMGLTAKNKIKKEWEKFEEVDGPGFLCISGEKWYLFVEIDRATRCVWIMLSRKKDSLSAVLFLKQCSSVFPFKIHTALTDNGKEFTDRGVRNKEREPSGNHPFDIACKQMKIKHKLTKPYHAQTIGKIEQHVVKQYKAPSINDLFKAIADFLLCYHLTHHSSIGTSPLEKLKEYIKNKDPVRDFFEKLIHLSNGDNKQTMSVNNINRT